MRGGFKQLVHPGTQISEIDVEATRSERNRVHEEVEMRSYIAWLLVSSLPGDGLVRVTPYQVLSVPESEAAAGEAS